MDKLKEEIKKNKGAKYLIVNRRYYELICIEIAKEKRIKDYFLVIADMYKHLIVAVTDKKDFNYEII